VFGNEHENVNQQTTQADNKSAGCFKMPALCANRSKHSHDLFQQGDEGLMPEVPAGYPSPACMNLHGGTGVFVSASYLYWTAGEGGLDLAVESQYVTQTLGLLPVPNSTVIFQDTKYSSGFKVGLGYVFPYDGWILRADYTWFHQSNHLSETADWGANAAFQLTNWFYQTVGRQQTPGCTQLSSKWKLKVDWVDLVLQRPFYAGRQFTLNPFLGLKGMWIRQSMNLSLDGGLNFNPPGEATSKNSSTNWAIGPRLGVDARFLLGAGVRFQGSIAESILYTKFTSTKHSEDPLSFGGSPVTFNINGRNYLRTMTELLIGLGWGQYFSNNRVHFDLSATYDFYFLPEQNQIRVLNDIEIDGVNATARTLYLQGLTVTATVGF